MNNLGLNVSDFERGEYAAMKRAVVAFSELLQDPDVDEVILALYRYAVRKNFAGRGYSEEELGRLQNWVQTDREAGVTGMGSTGESVHE